MYGSNGSAQMRNRYFGFNDGAYEKHQRRLKEKEEQYEAAQKEAAEAAERMNAKELAFIKSRSEVIYDYASSHPDDRYACYNFLREMRAEIIHPSLESEVLEAILMSQEERIEKYSLQVRRVWQAIYKCASHLSRKNRELFEADSAAEEKPAEETPVEETTVETPVVEKAKKVEEPQKEWHVTYTEIVDDVYGEDAEWDRICDILDANDIPDEDLEEVEGGLRYERENYKFELEYLQDRDFGFRYTIAKFY